MTPQEFKDVLMSNGFKETHRLWTVVFKRKMKQYDLSVAIDEDYTVFYVEAEFSGEPFGTIGTTPRDVGFTDAVQLWDLIYKVVNVVERAICDK